MDNVFVINIRHVINASGTLPDSKWCDCVDSILKHPDPNCMSCGGSGVIKYPSDFSSDEEEVEPRRLTQADIRFETDSLWDGEDEDFPVSNIMAYFDKDENVEPGNQIMHKAKLYSVITSRVVVDVDNVQKLECALVRA
jgi:hypothetical protein